MASARVRAWTGLVLNSGAPTVQNVIPESPAALAGLSFGMELLAVDGWRTSSTAEAQKALATPGVGAQLRVLAADRGRVQEFQVRLAENPERSHRLVARAAATAGQRRAFKASYGQAFPVVAVKPGKRS